MKPKKLPPNFAKWAEFFATWSIDYSLLVNDPDLGPFAFSLPDLQLLIVLRDRGHVLTSDEQSALSRQAWVSVVASHPATRSTIFCQTSTDNSGGWATLDALGWGIGPKKQFGIVADIYDARCTVLDWHWRTVPSVIASDKVHRWANRIEQPQPFWTRKS